MKRLLAIMTLLACALPAAAVADDTAPQGTPGYTTGTIGLEYKVSNVTGSNAKANEYEQAGEGPRIHTSIDWLSELYQFSLNGSYSGDYSTFNPTDAQTHTYDFASLFRKNDHYVVAAYADSMVHNLSDGLTNKADITDTVYARKTGTSTDFTYNRQRTRSGVEAEVSHQSPFFAGIKLDSLSVTGLMPLYNVTEGNVPYPVDYEVNTVTLQTGYRSPEATFVINGSMDSLDNDVAALRATRTGDVESGNTRLPVQESASYRLGSALTYRLPDLRSTFMVDGAFANLTSDAMASSRSSGNTAATSWDEYTGDIKTTDINAAFTSTPRKGMTTRLYGRYHQRQNDSDIVYNADWLKAATAATILQTQARDQMAFYGYTSQLFGGEVSQKLGDYKLTGGAEWHETSRESYGITQVRETDDISTWGQVRVAVTDDIAARIRYDLLNRQSTDTIDTTAGAVLNPSSGVIAPWFSYADTAGKQQHKVKTGLEWSLTDNLSLGLDYIYKLDDYTRDAPLGLEHGESHGGMADLSYTYGPAQFHAFGSLERGATQMHTRLYRGTGTTEIGGANPDTGDSSTAYDWGYTQYDTTLTLGAGATFSIIKDRLNLQVQYDFTQNDGKTDLHIPAAAGITREDIRPVNDYTQHNVSLKLNHTLAEGHTVGMGYTYTRLSFEDWGYNETVTSAQKLTDGYYNVDPSYEVHTASIFYRYTF